MLGEMIHNARIELNLSEQKVADYCHIKVQNLQLIENGNTKTPHLSTLEKLTEILKLDGEVVREEAGYIPTHSPDDDSFGAKVERARLNRFLSRSQLSQKIGIEANTLLLIENGQRKNIQENTRLALCRALDLT